MRRYELSIAAAALGFWANSGRRVRRVTLPRETASPATWSNRTKKLVAKNEAKRQKEPRDGNA